MADFNPNPYRGEASIPHVSEDFFKVYFIGAQVRQLSSACLHFFSILVMIVRTQSMVGYS